MPRKSDTYRAERRNRAKRQRLIWRELRRQTTHKLSATHFVDVPRDSEPEGLDAREAAASQPTTSGERHDI